MNEEETALLRRVGQMALKRAMEECTRTGRVDPLVVAIRQDESVVVQSCAWAAEMMNDGGAKDHFFTAMRSWVKAMKLRGIVIVTEAWMGKSTEKGMALINKDLKRWREYAAEPGYKRAVAEGLLVVEEALLASAQCEHGALLITQPFVRNEAVRTITYGKQSEMAMGPDGLHGRQKMFGDLRPEWTR